MDPYIAAGFGAAGVPAGILLNALIERLAVPFEDDDAGEEERAPEGHAQPGRWPPASAESGSLALDVVDGPGGVVRQVAVVAATAGLFTLAAARYPEPWQAAIVCAYLSVLIVCTATDLLVYRVPDVVTYPGMLLALVVGLLAPGSSWERPLIGGAVAGAILLLPSLLTRGQMGMGDVKLAAFGGLALGWRLALPALVVMALAGGIAAAVLLVVRRRGRRDAMPYAPYVALGIALMLLLQGTAFHALR